MRADIHCHSTLSDGAMSVEDIMEYARRIDLDYIAITDHESTHSIPAVKALGEELGIQTIPGVEIASYHQETDTNVHLLGYYPASTKRLQRVLDKDLAMQTEVITKSYETLFDTYPVTMDQLMEASRESTGVYYTHIMKVLADMGYTKTPIGELHHELFHQGSPHYLPKSYMAVTKAANLIHDCGGVVVLAHPGQYKNPMLMEMLLEEGILDGIELNHPRNDQQTMDQIQSLAKEHDVFLTGGTDFHGLYSTTPYPLGSFLCPEEGLERLILAGQDANLAYHQKHTNNVKSTDESTDEVENTEDTDVLDSETKDVENIETADVMDTETEA